MRLLFAITVCCFCAVVWVALALARRIRLGQVLTAKPRPVRNPVTREFFEAGEFRTPRPLHLDQEIFKQKPRRPLADIHLAFERRGPVLQSVSEPASKTERRHAAEPTPIRPPTAAYATLFGQNVSIAEIGSKTDAPRVAAMPSLSDQGTNIIASKVALPLNFTQRKPPQPVRTSGLRRRVDLSRFNNSMGDLSDPYTQPLRGSGTQGPASIDSRYRLEQ